MDEVIKVNGITLLRCKEWPIVLKNTEEHGLRPKADSASKCFYCSSKIGEKHGQKCVCVLSINFYEVLNKETNEVIGTWIHYDPYVWDEYKCNFHKNESSWCTTNAVEYIQWAGAKIHKRMISEAHRGNGCMCQMISFRFIKTMDKGPFIQKDNYTKE